MRLDVVKRYAVDEISVRARTQTCRRVGALRCLYFASRRMHRRSLRVYLIMVCRVGVVTRWADNELVFVKSWMENRRRRVRNYACRQAYL
jgi:hypothetical protein